MQCRCGQEIPEGQPTCPKCGKRVAGGWPWQRLLWDALLGLSLLGALGVVVLIDHLRGAPAKVQQSGGQLEAVPIENPLKIAVTPPEFDDMGRLLESLGEGYRYREIKPADLLDAETLRPFDVVFLTCGGAPDEWLQRRLRGGDRGSDVYTVRDEVVRKLYDSLRSYVGQGGTLYVSDWHYDVLKIAFPEFCDRGKAGKGAAQTVTAEVVDPGLRRRIGETLELRFDKPGWRPAAFHGPGMKVYLAGKFEAVSGAMRESPLLVLLPFEKGNIIFTSFHNEKQHSKAETELLRYLVFATVTARLDSGIQQTFVRGGFSPKERNLLSASPREESLSQNYQCESDRPLKFVLGFEDRGAQLRLVVTGPDGSRREAADNSTITIDVDQGVPGEWKCEVTPLQVPYGNFPFTLTIGEKE